MVWQPTSALIGPAKDGDPFHFHWVVRPAVVSTRSGRFGEEPSRGEHEAPFRCFVERITSDMPEELAARAQSMKQALDLFHRNTAQMVFKPLDIARHNLGRHSH